MKTLMIMMGASLLFQGCTYAISSDVAAQADKKITFAELETDPTPYKGKLVILGGSIAAIKNINQGTLIEVVQKPLDHWGKPIRTNQSGGRFLILTNRYLDAMVYSSGRDLTVAAVVDGLRAGIAADDIAATFPVVLSREIKLWPREPDSRTRPQHLDPLLYDPYAPPVTY